MNKAFAMKISSLCLSFAALLSGCATGGNPNDPIEGFNRAMFSVNEGVDKAVIKPVAQGYDAVLPQPVQTGVVNVFSNVADVPTAINNLLQGKPLQALSDGGRFLINSTLGLLGIFDVASLMGLEKHDEDFGQTFGRWGIGEGAYVVLPFFGPRTVRDSVGLAVDIYTDPIVNIENVPTRNSLAALRIVSKRAELLKADKVVEEAALDKYSYIRDAYLQHRRSEVYDGNPPKQLTDE